MTDELSIGERIGELAASQKVNLKQLAKKADVPYTTLYAIVNRRSNRIQRATLAKIARALGVSVEVLSGTGSVYLSDSESRMFKNRASVFFESQGADLSDIQDSGMYSYLRFNDDRYRPTKADVISFADDTGLSIAYLLGIDDEADENNIKREIRVPGFSAADIGLCELHIKNLIAKDLKRVLCSPEDAEMITATLLQTIGPEEVIAFFKLIDAASPESRKSAVAVLRTGVLSALQKKATEKGLRIDYADGYYIDLEPEFDIWKKAQESENVWSEFTIGSDLSIDEALMMLENYQPDEEKPPQDPEDPETV